MVSGGEVVTAESTSRITQGVISYKHPVGMCTYSACMCSFVCTRVCVCVCVCM